MAACNEPFHASSPSDFCGGCLTQKALGRRSAPLGKQRADRQRIRPHFSGQRFRVGRMPARSPSVKPPDAASPAASAAMASAWNAHQLPGGVQPHCIRLCPGVVAGTQVQHQPAFLLLLAVQQHLEGLLGALARGVLKPVCHDGQDAALARLLALVEQRHAVADSIEQRGRGPRLILACVRRPQRRLGDFLWRRGARPKLHPPGASPTNSNQGSAPGR